MFTNIILLSGLAILVGVIIHFIFTERQISTPFIQTMSLIIVILFLLGLNTLKTANEKLDTDDVHEKFIAEIREIISDDKIFIEVPQLSKKRAIIPTQIGDKVFNVKYEIRFNQIEIPQITRGTEINYDLDLGIEWDN